MSETKLISIAEIERAIHIIRGHRVMLDEDLAVLYGVTTRRLNEQVRRNLGRFPDDFMFRLNNQEVTNLMSQFATSSLGWGGRRKNPYAFTEHGAVMLANVLRSQVAVDASIQVVRAFIRLRELAVTHSDLALRIDKMEEKYDTKFKIVFDAIRRMMIPPASGKQRMGFSLKK